MPKLKTHKGMKKRMGLTKKGKIKRTKANKSHILTKKTRKRKRNLAKSTTVHKAMESKLKDLFPYGD